MTKQYDTSSLLDIQRIAKTVKGILTKTKTKRMRFLKYCIVGLKNICVQLFSTALSYRRTIQQKDD